MIVTSSPAPYHQQDYDTYCGPATAQMMLAPLLGTLLLQADLRKVMNGLPPKVLCKLSTSPEHLAGALNAMLAGQSPHTFAARYCPNAQPTANDILRQTLLQGTAAAACVFEGGHWVAVTGFTSIPEAVFLNNPFPLVPAGCCLPSPPTTHSTADGCGSGAASGVERGKPEHVPLEEWNDSYLTAVTKCRLPDQTFVVVGAAGACEGERRRRRRDAVRVSGGRSEFEARDRKESRDVIEPSSAVAILRDGIERYGLADDAAQACQSEQRPRLVERVDRVGDFYYIVSLTWPDGSTLVGRVDAHRGVYLGSQLRPAGDYRLMEPQHVLKLIAEYDFFSGGRDGAFDVPETLVWRPCQESRSPFYPLSRVTSGGETVGYVDIGGAPHAALNDLTGA